MHFVVLFNSVALSYLSMFMFIQWTSKCVYVHKRKLLDDCCALFFSMRSISLCFIYSVVVKSYYSMVICFLLCISSTFCFADYSLLFHSCTFVFMLLTCFACCAANNFPAVCSLSVRSPSASWIQGACCVHHAGEEGIWADEQPDL